MECDEKEFGCLCKNVGGHFPCLFHGLNVKKKQNTMTSWKVFKILTIFLFSFQSVPITTPESTTDIDNLGIIGKSQNML